MTFKDIEEKKEVKEDELLKLIQIRVSNLLDQNPDLLMSYLYRLDIDESKIKNLISTESKIPFAEGISNLILHRQKERIRLKKEFKVESLDDSDW